MLNKKFHILLFILLLTSLQLFSQWHSNVVEKFEIKDGLSQNSVNCVMQTENGILWFGTQDGLNRYDGYEFSHIRHEAFDTTTISSNYVKNFCQDTSGCIWIATHLGLNKYDPQTGNFQAFFHQPDSTNSLSSNIVNNVLIDNKNDLYVLTSVGLDKFNRKQNNFTHYDIQNDPNTNASDYNNFSIFQDNEQVLWVGTKDGLLFLDTVSNKLYSYKYNKNDNKSISCNEIRVIFQDSEDNLWFGTQNGLNKFDTDKQIFERFYYNKDTNLIDENIILSIAQDNEGRIWLGTGTGLKFFDIEDNKILDIENPYIANLTNSISDIVVDFSGIIWCTTRKGIYKIDNRKKQFSVLDNFITNTTEGTDDIFVYSIFQDKSDRIWIGANGVNIIDRATGSVEVFNHQNPDKYLPDSYFYSIFEDSKNNIWIGSTKGLFIYDDNKNEFEDVFTKFNIEPNNFFTNNRVSAIGEDLNGNIFIGTYNGLYKFENNKFERYSYSPDDNNSLNDNQIFSLCIDKQGTLWLGTRAGLNKFNPQENNFTHFTIKDGLSNNSVLCITDDSDGYLWLGTESGLNRFDKKSIFTVYTCKRTDFENDYFYGILEDDNNNLWLSSNQGIVKFSKNQFTKEGKNKITTYGKKDGLQSYEFNIGAYYKSWTGEMFFGGLNGVNYFNPDFIDTNKIATKVVFTKLLVGNKEIFVNSIIPIKLNYDDNLTLYFSLPEYTKPTKNLYKYRIIGISDNWSEPTKQHYLNLSVLKSGRYTFEIQGANSDKYWNKTTSSFTIIIIPPFRRSRIAIALYLLAGIIVLALFLIYITKNSRRKSRNILARDIALQENELQKEELEISHKNITDSINYAQKIIEALLPPLKSFKKIFPDSFILLLPKDIVSGDFYWFAEKNDNVFVAAVDCTGHGIPGAFMSIIGIDLFRNIIDVDEDDPSRILNKMNIEVIKILQKQSDEFNLKDGMDLSLCIINKKTNRLKFSGAYNPLYLLRDGNLTQLRADRFSVGHANIDENEIFSTHNFKISENDVIYIFSDGYTDQFGGVDNKKFKFRRFRHLLLSIHEKPLEKQKQILELSHLNWRREAEQVDDIIVIGFKPYKSNNKIVSN